jgi:hypothetical protein
MGLTEIVEQHAQRKRKWARYFPEDRVLVVETEQSPWVTDPINKWASVHWRKRRWPWKTCVGITVQLPPNTRFREDEPAVIIAIRRLGVYLDAPPFGRHQLMVERLVKGMTFKNPR